MSGLQELHLFLDTVRDAVLAGQGEGRVAHVDRIDGRAGKRLRAGDGDGAAAGADLQHPPDPFRIEPGLEAALDPLRDGRPRHQCAGVACKLQAREPGPAGQIRGGRTFADAAHDQVHRCTTLRSGETRGEQRLGHAGTQTGRVQHEDERLVHRVVGAVAEHHAGLVEPGRPPAHEIGDRAQLLDRGAHLCIRNIARDGHGTASRVRGVLDGRTGSGSYGVDHPQAHSARSSSYITTPARRATNTPPPAQTNAGARRLRYQVPSRR